jgi:hypothetical protein
MRWMMMVVDERNVANGQGAMLRDDAVECLVDDRDVLIAAVRTNRYDEAASGRQLLDQGLWNGCAET